MRRPAAMIPHGAVQAVRATRVDGATATVRDDVLAVEQPLEIRVRGRGPAGPYRKTVAVTMRTPGHDAELAVGFLLSDGLIARGEAVVDVEENGNTVTVLLADDTAVDWTHVARHDVMHGGCGVCGKKSIAAVHVKQRYPIAPDAPRLRPDAIHRAMAQLRDAQPLFRDTGGIHAAALANPAGNVLAVREDVGRHNALDKLLGAQALAGALPPRDGVVLLSGRAGFELVQKAAVTGIPVLCAVGAPSSLAVDLARDRGITLLGFVREGRFTIYAGAQRIVGRGAASEETGDLVL